MRPHVIRGRIKALPGPLVVSTVVVLALFVVGYQTGNGDMVTTIRVNKETNMNGDSGKEGVNPRRCFEDQPWIQAALDHFFEPALKSASESKQTSEESVESMKDIEWSSGYHPSQDVIELVYDEEKSAYVLDIQERYPANEPHKSTCIHLPLEKAIERYGKDLADYFKGKSIKFVVTTEDFGIIFRSQKSKLPAFSLSTDSKHTDIPVPDFTFGCYPSTHYNDSSWESIKGKLFRASDALEWSKRRDVIFHRSNWGVGPRQGLMPMLEKMHEEGKDAKLLGAELDIGDTGFLTRSQEAFVSLEEQCQFKSQIHTAGFSYSAGLKYKLACGSLVIQFSSDYKEFFEPAIKDGEHVVLVEAKSKGVDEEQFYKTSAPKIKAAVKKNRRSQSQVALQGQEFVKNNLTEEALSCYWYGVLLRYGELYLSPSEGSG